MSASVEPIRLDVTDNANGRELARLAAKHVAAGLAVVCIASLGATRTLAFSAKPHPKGAAVTSPTARLSGVYDRNDRLDLAMMDAISAAFKGMRADNKWE